MSNRTAKVVVWLDPQLKRRVERVAKAEGRSLSNLFRVAAERIAADNPAVSTSDWVKKISEGTRRAIAERRQQ